MTSASVAIARSEVEALTGNRVQAHRRVADEQRAAAMLLLGAAMRASACMCRAPTRVMRPSR